MNEELLNNYYSLRKDKKWYDCKVVIEQLLDLEPNDFWINTTYSSILYELKEYKKALLYSKKAFSINPNSPLVLWDYAGVLYMLDKEEDAIQLWMKLTTLSERKVGKELTSEGVNWARSLINDCYYRIGQGYYYMKNDIQALKYIDIHLSKRKRGLRSLYSKKEIAVLRKKILANVGL